MAGPLVAVDHLIAASTTELSIRMALSLALIGVLALVLLKVTRSRLGLGGARPGIAVEARHQLTRSASVVLVRAGERHFLVGVSDHQVSLLAEGDDLVLSAPAAGRGRPIPDAAGDGDGSTDGAGTPVVPVRASGGRRSLAPRPARGRVVRPRTQLPADGADGPEQGGARRRHRRAARSASSRMGVIEALRERTVRRG